ncbi:50S ribosomal protein L9 [Brucepastera parasyntrophica]|uniref:50S ribosomal protein L9 n=1 Tax=Brucepastera parasyntrophica TaxID=2880008 RepID=UPI00210A4ECB|nr:50S ribosomal protein L9 [Brucepastera parasyntrophica]ULQ59958.1 50S ribosomal protein L9 [Brucepastera parasyntrophica]
MKVILNQDVKHLGEEGDIKDVANGYARNYLLPRNLAVPCNEITLAHFEGRKAEIEARKEAKRKDASGLREKLEATVVTLVMPAGPNGKLYGAVTSQTIADELQKLGYDIERKRINVPGLTFKTVGKYQVTIGLYESASAAVSVVVEAQEEKTEKKTPAKPERHSRRPDRIVETAEEASHETASPEEAPVVNENTESEETAEETDN